MLNFHGHYAEPALTMALKLENLKADKSNIFMLEYNPTNRTWALH